MLIGFSFVVAIFGSLIPLELGSLIPLGRPGKLCAATSGEQGKKLISNQGRK